MVDVYIRGPLNLGRSQAAALMYVNPLVGARIRAPECGLETTFGPSTAFDAPCSEPWPRTARHPEKAHGGFTAMCSANAASDSGRAQSVLRRLFITPNAASPTARSATVSGSGTAGVTGTSTAVPCTPTVKPFQNSFVELRHVTVSKAPLN